MNLLRRAAELVRWADIKNPENKCLAKLDSGRMTRTALSMRTGLRFSCRTKPWSIAWKVLPSSSPERRSFIAEDSQSLGWEQGPHRAITTRDPRSGCREGSMPTSGLDPDAEVGIAAGDEMAAALSALVDHVFGGGPAATAK